MMMEVLTDEFIKLCYEGFKENDEKFPEDWTLKIIKNTQRNVIEF